MALKDSVKLALRISTTKLDGEIQENINAAKAELKRVGVATEAVDAEGDLVALAIKTFVLARMCNDKTMAEGYEESFRYQADNLRKSTFPEEDPDV